MRAFFIVAALLLAGCNSTKSADMVQGQLKAGVWMPAYPDTCRKDTPHAPLVEGDSTIATLDRERGQLDKANQKAKVCGPNFYDRLRAKLRK